MTIAQALILPPEQRRRALDVVGMHITVLAPNAATGNLGFTLQEGAEGTGPPPHRHGWDEAFFVLDGQVNIELDGRRSVCGAGTLVNVPGGTLHAFSFGPGGGRMLEITGAGASAAPFFEAIDEAIPPGPPDVPVLLELAKRHGVEFVL